MEVLSKVADKDEYLKNMHKKVLLGKKEVFVHSYERESQSGSYDRGFKWTRTTYGVLVQEFKRKESKYSVDHGATWHDDLYVAKKQRAGKIKLEVYKSQEFAFNGIQAINREYDSQYKWRP